ncbi:hypothetical protein O181_058363 [Austropuccinia psidii MF-1]|uniref:Reverse transcriptase Ty1/copia-type domain-containing protein n=1 Tax=Austropuccinia psidii MF-1 TaxID=1389203 RepID=A0A9Q3HVF1_9BASI|nr:hypothetical protein [Austropuccinia psidii MF-1]
MPKFLATPGTVRTAPLYRYLIPIRGEGHCPCARGPTVTQSGCKGHRVPTSQAATGLWDPANNQTIHSASAVFPHFQTAQSTQGTPDKGSLQHVLNTMILGKVLTKKLFASEERAINSLPLAQDISIPENLKRALAGPDWHHWEQARLNKLQQMKKHGVWQAIKKTLAMKTIGHFWVFDTKIDESGNFEKFKAQLVARSD